MILFKSVFAVVLIWELIYFSFRINKGDYFDL